MKELNEYVEKNRISESLESKVISYIERHVKINPLGVIDWRESAYSMLIEKVEKRNFIAQFFAMIKKMQSNTNDVYFILQVDGLSPSLQSSIDCWATHCNEILYPDTIFLSKNGQHIIHYDFYEDIWGKTIPIDFSCKDMEFIEN